MLIRTVLSTKKLFSLLSLLFAAHGDPAPPRPAGPAGGRHRCSSKLQPRSDGGPGERRDPCGGQADHGRWEQRLRSGGGCGAPGDGEAPEDPENQTVVASFFV